MLVALGLFLTAGGCSAFAKPPEFKGAIYGEPFAPMDFSLPSTTGEDFTLSEQRGKVTLLFFGYTFCPDECPQTLGTMRSALEILDPDSRAQIQLVLITVDPRRDTLEVMEGYLSRFDSGFIGVAPADNQLEALETGYAAFIEPDLLESTDAPYLVSHTSVVYVIDKEGLLRLGFFSGTPSDDIAHDLSILANE